MFSKSTTKRLIALSFIQKTEFAAFQWSSSGSHSMHIRAAAFDVTGRKTSATPSVIFRFIHSNAWQESSKFYSDLWNANSSELAKYYCVNCCCSAVTMLITHWVAMQPGVQVRRTLLFSCHWTLCSSCHAEVLSRMTLWRQCSRSIA